MYKILFATIAIIGLIIGYLVSTAETESVNCTGISYSEHCWGGKKAPWVDDPQPCYNLPSLDGGGARVRCR